MKTPTNTGRRGGCGGFSPRKVMLFLVFAAFTAQAYDVTHYFALPEADGHVFAIDRNARLDMTDYYEAGLDTPTPVKNEMAARITAVSPDGDTMSWTLDDGLDYSLSVIKKGKKEYLLLIETMSMPERDSRIVCYDTSWHKTALPFDMPVLDDWLTPEGLKNRAYITAWLPYITAVAQKAPDANELIFNHTLNQRYVAADDAKRLEAWFKPSVTMRL